MAVGAVIARIITQYSAKGSKQAQKDIAKLGKDFDKFAKRSAIAFAAAGAAVGAFAIKVGKDAVQGAMEDQKQQIALATALRNVTGATDEAIASTVEYLDKQELLVGVDNKELIPSLQILVQATKDLTSAQNLQNLALDISAGTSKDLGAVSLALAKALGGNVGALTRLGVPLDAAAVKSKDLNAILNSLAATFAGQAEKRAATFEFRINKLNLAFNQVLDQLGYALIPVLEQFAITLGTQVLPKLQAWIDANKDELIAGLTTIVEKIPQLITLVFDLFDYIQRNLGTIKVLAGLLVSTFAGAKVYAGVVALTAVINTLTAAFARQTAAASAATVATAGATGGASLFAAGAALTAFAATGAIAYATLTKNTDAVKDQNAELDDSRRYWARIYDSKTVKSTGVINANIAGMGKNTKVLTEAQKKQMLTQEALNKLQKMGVTPTSETDPIQLEAVRLNLLKEQNLVQKRMYDQLLANYQATERMNIAAQRYADILMVISDTKITSEEVNLLAAKWGLTNYQVVEYLAKVTGNVNLGAGWDAAGLAAADGWKTALAELNAYLLAVGKGAFVAPKNVLPPTGGGAPSLLDAVKTTTEALNRVNEINKNLIDKIKSTVKVPDTPAKGGISSEEKAVRDALANYLAADDAMRISMPSASDFTSGGSGSVNVIVNNAGSTITSSDLNDSVRNGILAAQTSGRPITTTFLAL
jgi:hypothetical protein